MVQNKTKMKNNKIAGFVFEKITLCVCNVEHFNDIVTNNDHDDIGLCLFFGGNYERDKNSEKSVQRIRRFHWEHDECTSSARKKITIQYKLKKWKIFAHLSLFFK